MADREGKRRYPLRNILAQTSGNGQRESRVRKHPGDEEEANIAPRRKQSKTRNSRKEQREIEKENNGMKKAGVTKNRNRTFTMNLRKNRYSQDKEDESETESENQNMDDKSDKKSGNQSLMDAGEEESENQPLNESEKESENQPLKDDKDEQKNGNQSLMNASEEESENQPLKNESEEESDSQWLNDESEEESENQGTDDEDMEESESLKQKNESHELEEHKKNEQVNKEYSMTEKEKQKLKMEMQLKRMAEYMDKQNAKEKAEKQEQKKIAAEMLEREKERKIEEEIEELRPKLAEYLTKDSFSHKYTEGGRIGEGSSGKVVKGQTRYTQEDVAMKLIPLRRNNSANCEVLTELMILKRLKHEHIACYRDAFLCIDEVIIVRDFVDGISLSQLMAQTDQLKPPDSRTRPPELVAICRPILKVLANLSHNCVIHRNLQSENILLSTEGKVKVTGFSKSTYTSGIGGSFDGPRHCMAPEMFEGTRYDSKADVWAFGILLYEMVTGNRPYNDDDDIEELIAENGRPRIPSDLHYAIYDALSVCLVVDPKQRSFASALLNYPLCKFKSKDDYGCPQLGLLVATHGNL